MLTCLLALMITHFYVHMFRWSYALKSHAHLLVCLHAYTLGRFDDYLLLFSNNLMIACTHALISYAWYPCICAHTLMMKCLLARRLKWLCCRTFVQSNALMIVRGYWGDCEIWGMCTWVFKCSKTHRPICSHA